MASHHDATGPGGGVAVIGASCPCAPTEGPPGQFSSHLKLAFGRRTPGWFLVGSRAGDSQSPAASRKCCLASGGYKPQQTRPWLGLVDLSRIPSRAGIPGLLMAAPKKKNIYIF